MPKLFSELLNDATTFTDELFGKPNWSVGHSFTVVKQTDGSFKLEPVAAMINLAVVSTDAELAAAKTVSFANVFNTWQRVSIHGKNPHALTSEENAWTYNASTDSIVCSVNSETTIGFISPEKYDNYTFEVEIASTDGDDDGIGLCVAYIPQSDGSVKSLMLMRQGGSNVSPAYFDGGKGIPALSLVYQGRRTSSVVPTNAADKDPQEYVVAGAVGSMVFPDGAAIPATGIVTNGANGGWNVMGSIRLKIVRTPTRITCYSTSKGSTTYTAENQFTVDLTADERLKPFQAPAAIGFLAHSQPNSTYKSIQQPGLKTDIIDIRTNTVWKYENNAWASYPMSSEVCPFTPGQIVHSPLTKKSYFTQTNLFLLPIGSY